MRGSLIFVVLQEQPGEHAEQAGANGGNRTQDAFGVPSAVPFVARQIFLVKIVAEIYAFEEDSPDVICAGHVELAHVRQAAFPPDELGLGRWPDIGKWNKRHQRPIADQQPRANGHQRARAEKAKAQPGEEISQRDALQHPQQPDAGPEIIEAAIFKNSKPVEEEAADEDSLQRLGATDGRNGFAKRKNQGNSRHENEQRKN